MTQTIPFIPENAPFSTAQRAWLNGMLAGIYSGAANGVAPAAPAAPKTSVAILFGSESGNSEALSKRLAKAAQKRGFEARALGLDKIAPAELGKQKYALIVTS